MINKTQMTSIDWKSFLSRNDPVWKSLDGYFYNGPFTGNGLLGTVIHRQDANRGDGNTNTILISINRSDAIDSCEVQQEGYRWNRFAIGKFALTPSGVVKTIEMRIDLWNSEVTGLITTNKGTIEIRHFTHATEPVIITELKTSQDESIDNFKFLPAPSGQIKKFGNVDLEETAIYDPINPPAEVTNTANLSTHKQTLQSGRSFTVANFSKKNSHTVTHFTTIGYSDPQEAPPFDAADVVTSFAKQPIDSLVNSHRAWWHDYYPRCFVTVPDAVLESFFWIQQYKIGSSMRPNLQMLDLIGPWYVHTVWRGIWWNWNTQANYYHLYSCNKVAFGRPLCRILDNNQDALSNNLPEQYRTDSIAIGRASSYDCFSEIDMKDTPLGTGIETGNLTWVLHNYYLICRYTMDVELLRDKFFPLLRKSINLYLQLLEEDNEKRLHLKRTFSPEYKASQDCNYDLALLRWGCGVLVDICKKHKINDPLLTKWEDVLNRLIGYPINETGLMIGADTSLTEGHRHFSHLLCFYPLHIYNPDRQEQKEVIERSLDHWLSFDTGLAAWSHAVAVGMFATLGDGDRALKNFNLFLGGITANTMYREAGPCIETPLAAVNSMIEMLLQSWGNVIRIFPAVPASWQDCTFDNLVAEGNFLVSAVRKEGKTVFIRITSNSGERCIINSTIDKSYLSTNPVCKYKSLNDNTLELDIKEGQTVTLYDTRFGPVSIEPSVQNSSTWNSFGIK